MCESVPSASHPRPIPHAAELLTVSDDPPVALDGRSVADEIRPVITSLDRSIGDLTDRLQGSTDTADALGSQITALRMVDEALAAAGHDRSDKVDLSKVSVQLADGRTIDAATHLRQAGIRFDLNAPSAAERLGANITGRALAPQATVSRSQISARIDMLTDQRSQATSQNQLGMIRLQEILHQRNLLLQLTSNRLAAEEQTARALVGNIR